MSQLTKESEVEDCDFKWGNKKGIGGKKKEVQFYETFTYDGEEYSLYDNVYLYKEGEPEPYIGKLVKIWEQQPQKRKVKVLWFFRPIEIGHWLQGGTTLEKEILLATGDGQGLANINPLEAIAGKCHVVCTSKDSRNPQPSPEELRMADYIFYRTFDVKNCTISDKIDDKIAGLEVSFLFNREGSHQSSGILKGEKGENGNDEVSQGRPKLNSPERLVNFVTDDIPDHSKNKKDEDLKSTTGLGLLDDKPSKKARLDSSVGLPEDLLDDKPSKKARLDSSVGLPEGRNISPSLAASDGKNGNNLQKAQQADDNENDMLQADKIKSKTLKDPLRLEKGSLKKVKSDDKASKSDRTMLKPTASVASEKNLVSEGQVLEVTRRPETDRSKWFKGVPWGERMQAAHEQGTLVLLENLDPAYSSAEIEDIIWSGFREACTAKVVPHTSISSPHSGQAFAIFKSRETADIAVKKLDEGCLMLPNGRPLVASWGTPPSLSGKPSTFNGHLVIEKVKFQMQREEQKQAVSTSHCSQPNTIEYDMAMEWSLLQTRTDSMWVELYKQHGVQLDKLKANLKSK